jgi:arginine-tRNA-protein transferase
VESRFTFVSKPARCEYLPDRDWQLQYEVVARMEPVEYLERLEAGWRRFGYALFRPVCTTCTMCQSIRVPVAEFEPHRTQRRVWRANAAALELRIGAPAVQPETLDLYLRFHRFQHRQKGWPAPDPEGLEAFVDNPFATEEWQYWLDGRLVAVGYVDALPAGLSAIYFFWDPVEQQRSLGTFNVLSILAAARERCLPFVYLGYYVEGCRSLEYKARFQPNEILHPDGSWRPFRTGTPLRRVRA